MNRNRITADPLAKQSSIASISSHVPLLSAGGVDDQRSPPPSPAANAQSFLDSMKTTTIPDGKRGRTICQPKGTMPYKVGNSDTLEKIALQYNATPSELLHLNKLNTRMVFPGQILYVPDESSVTTSDMNPSTPSPASKKDGDAFILLTDRRLSNDSSYSAAAAQQQQQDAGAMVWSMGRQTAAKPGRAQRLKSDASQESESSTSSRTIEDRLKTQKEDNSKQVKQIQKILSMEENRQLDEECLQRFIKVNVRLLTDDQKSIAGTILVTPNAVMFDPDVLDPLVKEHGIDKYGLIIRMDLLAGIALYEDIATYEQHTHSRDGEHDAKIPPPSSPTATRSNTDDGTIFELISSLTDRIEAKPSPPSSMLVDVDDTTSRASSNACQSTHGVTADDFSQRFGEIDRLVQKQQEIYDVSQATEVPYYLCIKISTYANEMSPSPARSNSKSSDDVYGRKDLELEYWFSVPKEKCDHLYAFFLRWTPEREATPSTDDRHGSELSASSRKAHPASSNQARPNENSSGKGFVLLANDDSALHDDCSSTSNPTTSTSNQRTTPSTFDNALQQQKLHYLKRQNTLLKEWEIINVDEIHRRIHANQSSSSYQQDILGIPPPKLLQASTLINEDQSKQILLELPARVHGLNWQLIFSTETHGFSLNQLYRRGMEVDQDSPALLIVKDIEQNIFGAYISQQLMVSEGFYGTGESFLFTFHPQFRVYKWTGHNQFFVKGDVKALGIGCGEGTYGLWLDADLYHGRTCPSKTFNNVRLSSKEDFIVASVEIWTFLD